MDGYGQQSGTAMEVGGSINVPAAKAQPANPPTLRSTLLEARSALRVAYEHLQRLDDALIGAGCNPQTTGDDGGDCIHKIAADLAAEAGGLRDRIAEMARMTGADM